MVLWKSWDYMLLAYDKKMGNYFLFVVIFDVNIPKSFYPIKTHQDYIAYILWSFCDHGKITSNPVLRPHNLYRHIELLLQ